MHYFSLALQDSIISKGRNSTVNQFIVARFSITEFSRLFLSYYVFQKLCALRSDFFKIIQLVNGGDIDPNLSVLHSNVDLFKKIYFFSET